MGTEIQHNETSKASQKFIDYNPRQSFIREIFQIESFRFIFISFSFQIVTCFFFIHFLFLDVQWMWTEFRVEARNEEDGGWWNT